MMGLIIKDFEFFKLQKRLNVALLVFFIAVSFFNIGISVFIGYIVMFSAVMAVNTISYDSLENGMSMLMTLPITRREYVLSKFISSFGCAVISSLLVLLISIIHPLSKGQELDVSIIIAITVAVLAAIMIITSVMIPIQIEFGAEKSAIALMTMSIGFIVIAVGGFKLLEKIGKLNAVIEFISNLGMTKLIIIAIVVAVLAYTISIIISTKLMEKKEL